MVFARKVWKLLVAIKDGLALLLLLLFFLGLYAVFSVRPGASAVKDGALLLKLDGAIVEEPSSVDPLAALFASEAPLREYGVHDVVRGLRLAAADARIKAVVLDLSRFVGGGQVSLTDVGAALDQVRAARKPVLVFSPLYTDDALQLAAHGSEVWVDPLGAAIPTGPGGSFLFYGPLLERFKVKAHVFRVGTYKSAVEPYIRSGFSPEAKESERVLYSALWESWKADVARARPRADIAGVTADPVGWLERAGGDAARAALSSGLVDRIGDRTQFGRRVAQLVGPDTASKRAGAFLHTTLDTWLGANPAATDGRAIGVVTIAGDIMPGEAGPGTAGGERIVRLLDEAQSDNLAALVVRVDSPGGVVTAGEDIRAAIARYKARKIPVVVSMGNVAASGGYWVSTAADRIFAEPATVTGSIGVFAVLPSFESALAQYGVTSDGFRTTPLSGQPDVLAGLSPEIAQVMQGSVAFSYQHFLRLVAAARGKTTAQVDAVAQGRVWDGGTARQIGLVDQFGSLDDALAYAAKAAGLPAGGWHAQFLGRERRTLPAIIRAMFAGDEDAAIGGGDGWTAVLGAQQDARLRRIVADLDRLEGTRGMQAYCMTCPVGAAASAPQPLRPDALELLARLPRQAR